MLAIHKSVQIISEGVLYEFDLKLRKLKLL